MNQPSPLDEPLLEAFRTTWKNIRHRHGLALRPPGFALHEGRTRLGLWRAGERTISLSRPHALDDPWLDVVETLLHELAHQVVDELLGGLPQLVTMREALQQAEEDWPTLLGRLQRMRTVLLSADGAVVDLSADGSSLAAVSALVEPLLAQLPPSSSSAAAGAPAGWQWAGGAEGGLLVPSYEGLQVPTQVNYVAKAAPIYQPGEAVPGSTSVITRYLRTAYLWDAVRVQGGAYGCSLGFSRFDGVASFSSYRDPNVKATLDNYDGTGAFLRSNPLGPAELSKAIIGAVGDLDAPQSVDAKGYTSMVRHMLGVTEEDRQVWRDQVLSTTAADFVNFAERIDTVAQQGSVAAVASERAIAEANEALPEGKRLVPKAAL